MEDTDVIYSEDGRRLVRMPRDVAHITFRIPEGVVGVEKGAFDGCKRVNCVKLPDSVTEVDGFAFEGCKGLRYPIYNKRIFAFMPRGNKGIYKVEGGIREVASGAFKSCGGLEEVVLPEGLDRIGMMGFYGCRSMRRINVPASVRVIGMFAFAFVNEGLEIEVDEGSEWFCGFEGSLFSKDLSTLVHCCLRGGDVVVVPDCVRRIAAGAFAGYDVRQVVVQKGVEEIGSMAFRGCRMEELHLWCNDANGVVVSEDAFGECAGKCVLYVPKRRGKSYREHRVFGRFKDIREE